MRTNLPVTDKEITLGETQRIVSKTDLKGRITYVNQTFLDISGFTEQELIGQPHNLVRHPDMPPGAFEDLWRDLKAGRPWVGYVKNRCKNGDYYWVEAHAAPIWENGQMVGYTSVRRKPPRAMVEAAEAAYKLFRENRAKGLCVEHGNVVKSGWVLQKFLRDSKLWQRLALGFGAVILIGAVVALLGITGLGELRNEFAALEKPVQVLQGPAANAERGAQKVRELEARVTQIQTQMLTVLALMLLAGGGIAVWLSLSVSRPMESVVDTFRKISGGDYDSRIDIVRNDEIGTILQGLETLMNRLGFEMAEAVRIANEMTRVKIALDNVSTGVMIADSSRTIIYANNSVQRILKEAEAALRQQLPNFNADRLIGQSIDQFHKNPQHQADMLANLTGTHAAKLEIGGRHMVVSASPVINEARQRLGTVAEWLDRTAEVKIENEVADIVSAATMGDLSKRLEMRDKNGFFASLSEGLNLLLDNTHQSLKTTSEVLGKVANGDLTQTIQADFGGIFGQLRNDTNSTVERLRDVVGRIQEASGAINVAAREIAQGNTDLSSRTEEQASSLEETASSMEELNATVRQNAENARQANQLAISSNDIATRGGEMVKQVVETMSVIQGSSKKIADIVGVIDSIAFQTNILALNAAVEAARAGELGRGFAVVATEVRNLAQRSATAAKEIKQLIGESVSKIDDGAKLADAAGDTMSEVVSSFRQVTSLVAEISNASREQSGGIEQVTQAVGQMDEVTQQNAALVEEAAAAAESLEEQAQGLVKAVSIFKLAEGGSGEKASSAAHPRSREVPARQIRQRAALPAAAKKTSTAHHAGDEEEWEEF